MSESPVPTLSFGNVTVTPQLRGRFLKSIGKVEAGKVRLRNPATRWLPWFDTFAGDVFRQFAFLGVESSGDGAVVKLRAISDPDVLFREQRDSSGDVCFRETGWDAPPIEADFLVRFRPAAASIDGHSFTGFTYWFEYSSPDAPIHRIVDRQTWELGGRLRDNTLCLRNWLTPPRVRLSRDTAYSTVGLDKWAKLLPGNLWARWSLLPSFDMQYGPAGILLGWFDRVSLIRTVVETAAGEDALRVLDMHLFEQSTNAATNPKTILWCPDVIDDTDALNLWTRVLDQEHEKSRRQFALEPEGPPAIVFSHNVWTNMRFDSTYEHVIDVACEFGADYVFIDPVWEHQEALKEELDAAIPSDLQKDTILAKFWHQNMCVTLDFAVAEILGGEQGLKALCERATAKGVKIISWMATHCSPNSALQTNKELGRGQAGIFAARESGRHPDTGYPASCWTLNLNTPVADYIRERILGVCKRTGLAGFLWDSLSNLGWWQIDYSQNTMRPQFDRLMELFSALCRNGLYIQPEAIATFSNHSCCGLHGGNIYAGDLLGFSYNTSIAFQSSEVIPDTPDGDLRDYDERLITGREPIDMLFRAIAHRRVPNFSFHLTPRDRWHQGRVREIKDILRTYRKLRDSMTTRTVLKDDRGVLWTGSRDGRRIVFAFKDQPPPFEGSWRDALADSPATDGFKALRVYVQDA